MQKTRTFKKELSKNKAKDVIGKQWRELVRKLIRQIANVQYEEERGMKKLKRLPGINAHSWFTVFQPGGVAESTCHKQLWTRRYVYGLLCTKPGRGSAHG